MDVSEKDAQVWFHEAAGQHREALLCTSCFPDLRVLGGMAWLMQAGTFS